MIDLKLLSDEELDLQDLAWGKIVGPAWSDPGRPEADKGLDSVLASRGFDPETSGREIRAVELERLRRFLGWLSLRMFLVMRKSGDYGPHGETNIKLSFLRNVLGLPCDHPVSYFEVGEFDRRIDELDGSLGMPDVEALDRELRSRGFELLGLSFPSWDLERLERHVDWLGANWSLFISSQEGGKCLAFYLGDTEDRRSGRFTVRRFTKEYARSPHSLYSIAGNNRSDKSMVLVRRESCQSIFHNKWDCLPSPGVMDDRGAVGLGFKRKAFGTHVDAGQGWPPSLRARLLPLYEEAVARNLMGHQMRRADPRTTCFEKPISALVCAYSDVPEAIDTVLADWVSGDGDSGGTIPWLVRLDREDPAIARVLFWIAMGDMWFADYEGDGFGLLNDLWHAMVVPAISDKGEPDFGRLAALRDDTVDFLFAERGRFKSAFEATVKERTYKPGPRTAGFVETQELFAAVMVRRKSPAWPNDPKTHPAYASTFWAWLWDLDPDSRQHIMGRKRELEREARGRALDRLKNLIPHGRDRGGLREFIIGRMEATGVSPGT